jgi:heparan-alpha-glucosaminide N-acetyltransferase
MAGNYDRNDECHFMNDDLSPRAKPERLISLDAYRGTIMLLMASAGFGLSTVAKSYPDSSVWGFIGHQTSHVEWVGCSLWDLIQPAFMFMVGVALPFSLTNRQARGQAFGPMLGHAIWRGVLLVLIAVFLSSGSRHQQTNWEFPNVLAQIGFGYPFLFLIAFTRARTTWIIAGSILLIYWLAFALYPLRPADFDWAAVGVPADWVHLNGFAAHWDKNINFASGFDVWFLNLFPRAEAFVFNAGGYQTLNFVPSLATMIFGLCAGRLLRSEIPLPGKIKRLLVAGLVGIVVGYLIGLSGACPIVKRIWTPSWAIFSTGWATLMLAGFVAVVDWKGWKRWTFLMVVVGLNPITIYCLWQTMGGWIKQKARTHFGQGIFESFGEAWIPALERGFVLLILWMIVWWMYRRKIFVRI